MREKEALKDLSDVLVLYQYLYMDSANRIIINNGMAELEIRLNENFEFFCRNLNFPDLPEMCHTMQMTLSYCIGVIACLKEQKPKLFPRVCGSEWDVIKTITASAMALTFSLKRRTQ